MGFNDSNIANGFRIVSLTIPTSLTRLDEVLENVTPALPIGKIFRQIDFLGNATQTFTIYDKVNATNGISHANGDTNRFPVQNVDKQIRVQAGTEGTVTAVVWF